MGKGLTHTFQLSESTKGNHFKPGQPRPARHMASWANKDPLATWLSGMSKTCSPYGELVRPGPAHHMARLSVQGPARHMASWANQDPLAIWRADIYNPAHHMASRDCTLSISCTIISSLSLAPSSLGYIVSCFISIGVTVETLR
ncbi:hypothetical protein YC2023_089038 [Brassica napus]